MLGWAGLAIGQIRNVTGVVTDAGTGSPLPLVSVQIKGTTTGAVTDNLGHYSVRVEGPEAVLVFSSTGYDSQEVQVGDKATIDVALNMANEEIEQVMVVAYGTVKKESFTGSADVISAEKLEKRPISNVTKGLEGLSSGLMTTSGSGQPGASSKVVLRGFGSMNASNEPLYVVDGIPYTGTINAINPADIESLTVLKDASAGALYGARGANGVIMITTKRGKAGAEAMKVDLKASWAYSNRAIKPYETLNEKEWLEYYFWAFRTEMIENNGVTPEFAGVAAIKAMADANDGIVGKNEQYNPFNYKLKELIDPATGKVRDDASLRYHTNWLDEATEKFPLRQEYTLTLTGGTRRTSYMISLGALLDKGILKTTRFQRYSGRVNVDAQPKEWFKIGLNTSYAATISNYMSAVGTEYSNVFYTAQFMGPVFPVYELDAEGNVKKDEKGEPLFDFGKFRPGGSSSDYNCLATLYKDKFSTYNDNVSSRFNMTFLDLKEGPIQGLKFQFNLGGDYLNSLDHTYENRRFGNADGVLGRAFKTQWRNLSLTMNELLSYTRTFGAHAIDVLVGHETYQAMNAVLYAGRTTFPVDDFYELDAASKVLSANSDKFEYNIQSLLSRVGYSYADRYYLSASYRLDGSSRFSKARRWGNFWSVGATWRISQEAFMQGLEWLNNLSLKASYGVQGNDNMQAFYYGAWRANFYPGRPVYQLNFPNAGAPGAMIKAIANSDLRWETNANLNVGLEGRFFNRFSFLLEYYYRRTTDMLMDYPVAMSLGFPSYERNIGVMDNQGFEFNLAADLIQLQDFRWGLSIMGATVFNKIRKLADNPEITEGNQITKEGYPIHSWYLPESAGIDPATGRKLYWYDKENKDGSIERAITSDAGTAGNTRVLCGDRIPKLYGSFSTELEYWGFDLSILCTYSIGGKILDGLYQHIMQPMYYGGAIHRNAQRAWKQPGDITDIPAARLNDNGIATSDMLIDASYFSIKNISFGYSFPEKWMKVIKLQSARLAFVADNVWLGSHLQGMDPQASLFGTTGYYYSPSRSFSLSAELGF